MLNNVRFWFLKSKKEGPFFKEVPLQSQSAPWGPFGAAPRGPFGAAPRGPLRKNRATLVHQSLLNPYFDLYCLNQNFSIKLKILDFLGDF